MLGGSACSHPPNVQLVSCYAFCKSVCLLAGRATCNISRHKRRSPSSKLRISFHILPRLAEVIYNHNTQAYCMLITAPSCGAIYGSGRPRHSPVIQTRPQPHPLDFLATPTEKFGHLHSFCRCCRLSIKEKRSSMLLDDLPSALLSGDESQPRQRPVKSKSSQC